MTSSLGAQRIAGNPQPTLGGSTYVGPEQLQWQSSQLDKIALMHETRSGEGCVVAIYRKPNIFRNSAGFAAQAGDA